MKFSENTGTPFLALAASPLGLWWHLVLEDIKVVPEGCMVEAKIKIFSESFSVWLEVTWPWFVNHRGQRYHDITTLSRQQILILWPLRLTGNHCLQNQVVCLEPYWEMKWQTGILASPTIWSPYRWVTNQAHSPIPYKYTYGRTEVSHGVGFTNRHLGLDL